MEQRPEAGERRQIPSGLYPEPEFLNVYGAQESIPINQFRQAKPGGPVR
jgi:hypothetical protein